MPNRGWKLLFICWVCVSPLHSQPLPQGAEFQVNSYTTRFQFLNSVAMNSEGNFVVVWYSYDGKGIKGQRFDSSGESIGSEFRVESYTTNYQVKPRIAAAPDGGFVVVWNSGSTAHNGVDGNLLGVAGRRIEASGTPLGGEFVINTTTASNQFNPAVASDSSGGFIVVWTSDGSTGDDADGYSVQLQRFASDGSAVGAETQVNTYTTGNQGTASLAIGSEGEFIVVWESLGSNGSDNQAESIQAQRFDSDGTAVASQFEVNTFTTGSQRDPRIGIAPDGSFLVAWDSGGGSVDGPDGDGSGLVARRYDPGGLAIGSEFVVNSYTTGTQRYARILVENDGDFLIVWQSTGSGTGDLDVAVLGQFFDSSGTRIGTEFQLNTLTTGFQTRPTVAGDREGKFVVAWDSDGSLGADHDEESVQARLYLLGGGVGDFVFFDADFDGIQDPEEPGLEGIRVNLYDEKGILVAWRETDLDGEYRFEVEEGVYYLEFEVPAAYSMTRQDRGTNDSVDSDANPTNGQTIDFTIRAGEDLTWDAGMTNGVGNFVWLDEDGDGVQDGGEFGVPGVTVGAFDALGHFVDSTTTDGDGRYRFNHLAAGDYFLEFTAPQGFCFTAQDRGGDDRRDSDADIVSGRSIVFEFSAGDVLTSWDAGLVPEASIGDRVWHDSDGNGIQDGGELGLSGIEVRLHDLSGSLLQTTTSGPTGLYSFDSGPGEYYLEFLIPPEFESTLRDEGTDDLVDSDVNTLSHTTVAISLSAGEVDTSWDAGLVESVEPTPALLGDRVWLDGDGDGLQDGGEAGVAAVEVRLLDLSDTLLQTTTTDGLGAYSFSVAAGTYYLQFVAPVGFELTQPNQGNEDTMDSDADPALGTTPVISVSAGEVDTSWDAGLVMIAEPSPALLGNRVWLDGDGDGLQDGGEAGVAAVEVRLFDLSDTLLQTTATDGLGVYSFSIAAGTYYLQFVAPVGFELTQPDQGDEDTVDSDADSTLGTTVGISLVAGEVDSSWDAGIVPMSTVATLGDRVWFDSDGNGLQDGGEIGAPDVTVRLFHSASLVEETVTDATGSYAFSAESGEYYLEFVPPAGFEFTLRDQGGDDGKDSDVNPATGTTTSVNLVAGQQQIGWDAGLISEISTGNLGDRVWLDLDGDGIQDGGEIGVSGVEVRLHDSLNGLVQTMTTDQNGLYRFDVEPGEYFLEALAPPGFNFTSQDRGSDESVDSDFDVALGTTALFSLDAGQVDTTLDAGIEPTVLGDRVWQDSNRNGIQDAGELGVVGIRVDLLDETSKVLATTVSDFEGRFGFSNLATGTYVLSFVPPAVWLLTSRDQGDDDTGDSDADPVSGRTEPFLYETGTSSRSMDAGLIAFSALIFADGFESGDTTGWSHSSGF